MAKARMFTPATIKRFTSVHSWVGIFAGMALFIAFFAGALTLYAGPMRQWANPELRQSHGTMRDVEKLIARVASEPVAKGNFTVSFDEGDAPSASFFERGGRGGASKSHNYALDGSANVIERRAVSSVEHRINEIHYTVGLPKRPGYTLMGVISAVYGLALVTGLLIHLPHLLADIYALRVGPNLKKMWLDAHNAIGILSLPFHLMFAFTGLLICILGLLGSGVSKVSPTDAPAQAYEKSRDEGRVGGRGGRGGEERGPKPAKAAMLPAAQIIAIAAGQASGFAPTAISYSGYGTEKARAIVRGHFEDALISHGAVEVSPVTGMVGKIDAPGARSTVATMEGAYRFLHYGDYGGELMKAVYLVLGLAGAFLFYSGNLLWIESNRRRRHAEQPMAGWRIAQITVGVCLGSCFGIALMLAGVRLLPVELANRGEWESYLYYGGFFGCLMWSLGRPPIRAAIEVLFACAAAYALLPLLNAVLTKDGLPQAFVTGMWDVAVIDMILLGMGVGFLLLGRAAVRRARNGQPNSVWSLTSYPTERVEPPAAPQAVPA